jgi:hypothetical protein
LDTNINEWRRNSLLNSKKLANTYPVALYISKFKFKINYLKILTTKVKR